MVRSVVQGSFLLDATGAGVSVIGNSNASPQREALPDKPSLRAFASEVGLTPARLSRIERGMDGVPEFEHIQSLGEGRTVSILSGS